MSKLGGKADPVQAWNVLDLVNYWILHAETKAATILAGAGLVGGLLYSLVTSQKHKTLAFEIVSVVCCVLVFAAVMAAAASLLPRLSIKAEATSRIYFMEIARRYHKDRGPASYANELSDLISDRDELARDIAGQIWANAHVASQKFRWNSRGLVFIILAVVGLGAVAVIASVQGPT